jgi:hypothetical protein
MKEPDWVFDKGISDNQMPPAAQSSVKVGNLFYDGTDYIFQQTENGPTVFAEIRGFGAGLPMDENAEKLCRLWNAANEESV